MIYQYLINILLSIGLLTLAIVLLLQTKINKLQQEINKNLLEAIRLLDEEQ